MIGALGILVAITGFVFLWAMLSYHTMNKIRIQMEEIKTNIESLEANSSEETKLLNTYRQRYNIKKQDYNEMVTEMPSKMVARLFKFSPVS